MLDGLQQRVGLRTVWGLVPATKQATQIRQAPAQPLEQMIKRLQPEGQRQRLGGGFDGTAFQQPAEQLPQPRGGNRVARQHLGQKEGKGPSAAATLAAIGAKDPLAAQGLAAYGGRVIAVKLAMAVQALSAAAVRTPLLLEQKGLHRAA
jgi:hypothetical protein